MNLATEQVSLYFTEQQQFSWVVKTNRAPYFACETLISFYNPARAAFIQIVSEQEQDYLLNLPPEAQQDQLDSLAAKHVCFLIFSHETSVAPFFLQQNQINILSSTLSANQIIQSIGNRFSSDFLPSEIIQGGLLIVENQGILITGKSGAGKSQLLLSLLSRGHSWVSEELTHCYLNFTGELMGQAVGELASFAHVKHLGPINIDKTFGLSKRLNRYPLAGVIQLEENSASNKSRLPLYEQKSTKTILGQDLPMWIINPGCNSLDILIETCAKQLILSQWQENAAQEMKQELEEILCETP